MRLLKQTQTRDASLPAREKTSNFPLRLLLVVPFVLEIGIAVGLTGWLCVLNGERAARKLASQWQVSIAKDVEHQLLNYLEIPRLVNRLNEDALRRGELDVENLSNWRTYLLQQVQRFEAVNLIQFGGKNREYVGIERLLDNRFALRIKDADAAPGHSGLLQEIIQGDRPNRRGKMTLYSDHFNPRNQQWYRGTAHAGKPQWSNIHVHQYSSELALSLGKPYFDSRGNLQGVLAVNLTLSQIDEYLSELDITRSGKVMIVEQSGLLVASSSNERPFKANNQRLRAVESTDPLIRATAEYLSDAANQKVLEEVRDREATQGDRSHSHDRESVHHQDTFKLNGDRQYLHVTRLSDEFGLDWTIAVVIPESDFMGQIYANRRTTFVLCTVALVGATILGILTAQRITRPILALSRASEAVAEGRLEKTVPTGRIAEINTLARSFNQMIEKLMRSFRALQEANVALQRSEQRFRDVSDAAGEYVWEIDANGRYRFLSDRVQSVKGHSPKELLGRTPLEFMPPEDMPHLQAILKEASASKSSFKLQHRGITPTGEVVWEEVSGLPMLDPKGEIIGFRGTGMSITERKRAEEALRQSETELRQLNEQLEQRIRERTASLVESEARFRAIATHLPGAVFQFTSRNGVWGVDYMSDRIYEIAGVRAEDMMREFNLFTDRVHPEDLEEYITSIATAIEQETPWHYEGRIVKPDGEVRWWQGDSMPIRNEEGNITFFGVLLDISDRKQTEEALRLSEERLRLMAETLPVCISYVDTDQCYRFNNKTHRELFGFTQEEFDGKTIREVIGDKAYDYVREYVDRALAGESVQFEVELPMSDGSIHSEEVIFAPQCGADGRAIGFYIMVLDLSDRKRAELELAAAKEAAEAASRAKSEFLANMSHELRTPLNGIMGYAQILQRSKSLNEKERNRADIIYQCGSHLLTLIEDVLDLSKIEAQKMELHPSDFHFPAFLQSVAEMCRIRAEVKGIDFHYASHADLPEGIRADEKRLRQVLLNLLSNAIKFTHEGSVTLKVGYAAGGKIRFEVSDTGVGMTPEEIEQIFLPFEQTGEGKRHTEGTGLGLPISKKIVELMGGTIQVSSQKHAGSIFWFDVALPAATEWTRTSQVDRRGQIVGVKRVGTPEEQHTQPKLLVVDDKWENRSVIRNLLESIGFEITEAADGREGLDKALATRPDLIITDLLMPGLDGWEMIRHLRQMEEFQTLPIIASSASVFESDRYQSYQAGGSDFLPKPVDATELFKKLQQHLDLEWIYEEGGEDLETGSGEDRERGSDIFSSSLPLSFPPFSLEVLHELAMKGSFKGILKYVDELERGDPNLRPFTAKVRQLAKGFQDRAILELIQPYRSGNP